MAPLSWIIQCLDVFAVTENIMTILVKSIKKWELMLHTPNLELGQVDIRRDIFQGRSLSHILALITLGLILTKTKASYEFSQSIHKIVIFSFGGFKIIL